MAQNDNNKKILIVGIIAVIIIVGFFVIKALSKQKPPPEETDTILPEAEVIPTISEDVDVTLTALSSKKEVMLTVGKIPAGTASIEYELSYIAKGGLPKGVIGTIDITGTEIERKITLGTCSSGSCVYDQGVEQVKVLLKFNGDYGSRLFEKEFEI
ncbi:MAG TPA: hypothetical protein VJH96_01315 [Patescibacteria group bacterium]|nr:hypothetical protein [Patescibacteria group bacterium]